MTRKCDVKGKQGFTLMELLVVLLIIGILSTVALRTIDATRDRSLFDQTTKEMNQLVEAITGNPDLTYDGRRVDFGYFGDMEKLPDDPRDLVRSSGNPAWHGPYLRIMAAGDTAGFLHDGWGNKYNFNWTLGEITSLGNGKFPMTVKIVDALPQLNHNTITGTVTDIDGNPPGTQSLPLFAVWLFYNNPPIHARGESVEVVPDPGGFYEFSQMTPSGPIDVPIGIHKLVARTATEALTRWVTVLPRSKTVVDFKFSRSFWNKLRMVGAPTLNGDSSGFLINVVNDQPDDVIISSLAFFATPESAYMRDFRINSDHAGYPTADGLAGTGPGDTVNFTPVTIAPDGSELVELYFADFYVQEVINPPPGTKANVHGKTFLFRFSDGSEITVNP
jgi:prepilin-type N-terminal cleavage/methylation domain-containing protein